MDNQKTKQLEYRIFSASGTYPTQSIISENSAFLINNQLAISIWDKSVEHSEQILNSGLLLATNLRSGFLKLYGFPFKHVIESAFSEDLLQIVEAEIKTKIKDKTVIEGDILPEFDCYQNAKGASLPLIFGGLPYSKSESLIDCDSFTQITEARNKKVNLELFNIVERLIMSSKLSCHFQFQTEACHYLLLAIEKYAELHWAKPQPLIKKWHGLLQETEALRLAMKITPIEYIKIYSGLVTSIKNSYLA